MLRSSLHLSFEPDSGILRGVGRRALRDYDKDALACLVAVKATAKARPPIGMLSRFLVLGGAPQLHAPIPDRWYSLGGRPSFP